MKEQEEKVAKGKLAHSKAKNVMNGRALFTFNPELFKDADGAGNAADYEEEKQPEEPKADEALFAGEQVDDEDVDFD